MSWLNAQTVVSVAFRRWSFFVYGSHSYLNARDNGFATLSFVVNKSYLTMVGFCCLCEQELAN